MNNILNMSLSSSEIERYAYVTGNLALHTQSATEAAIEELEESIDDRLEEARKQGRALGLEEGMGSTATEKIQALEDELRQMAERERVLRVHIGNVIKCLGGDQCKTIGGRKDVIRALHNQFGYNFTRPVSSR